MNTLPLLILLAALVVIAALLVLLLRQRPRPRTAAPAAPAARQDPFGDVGASGGDPLALRVGDMVEFGAERGWVRGTLRLSEGGSDWAEHFIHLDDRYGTADEVPGGSGPRRWLSVEADPDVQMALWTGRPEADLAPGPRTLDFEGRTYRLSERGTAAYRSEGTTGLRAQGGMDYADYEADDGALLAFERFDHGRWEAATGAPVHAGDVLIYGSGAG
ncbi:DUF4178 domain-containing protein [Nocardiopsis coralliicola]